ncbi:hypothetical protein D1006_39020 [Burkholderia stabilis]|uniref:RHS repeat-associated core domain-containing protein n=1 Tax=Burkholderia stabilis TaxID=95485 RepID=A0A4Q2A601_9BURK|nr:hypothetical protein D1006_39020 [Burkholderia stabilis]
MILMLWSAKGGMGKASLPASFAGFTATGTQKGSEILFDFGGRKVKLRTQTSSIRGNGEVTRQRIAMTRLGTPVVGPRLRQTLLHSAPGGSDVMDCLRRPKNERLSVQILHWSKGRPAGIPDDQVRFSLDNQIGSSCIELDGQADILTLEEYFPFGGTAVWSSRSETESQYKFLQYSGKERDATGLYYYGYRYYAPWMARWINPDPAGIVDGLNLYRMVRNNPVLLEDFIGAVPTEVLMAGLVIGALIGLVLGYTYFPDSPLKGVALGIPLGLALSSLGYTSVMWRSRRRRDDSINTAAHDLNSEMTQKFIEFTKSKSGEIYKTFQSGTSVIAYTGSASLFEEYEGKLKEKTTITARQLENYGFTAEKIGTVQLSEPAQPGAAAAMSGTDVLPPSGSWETSGTGGGIKRKGGKRKVAQVWEEPVVRAEKARSVREGLTVNVTEWKKYDALPEDERTAVERTIEMIQIGESTSVNLHKLESKGKTNIWSADVTGIRGSTGRGAWRLLFNKEGSVLKAFDLMNPHR